MVNHLDNELLSRIDGAALAQLEPHLSTVELRRGAVIAETGNHVRKVYFPQSGIISCVVELIGGDAIETGMIGKDGQYGAGPALDHKISMNHVVVQVAGHASVIDSAPLRQLAVALPRFRQMLMHYEQFFLAQVQQTCACNAVHDVQSRTCRWLLRMQKLVGDDLRVTQEFLAQMMGVRRTSVTLAASDLQDAGLIAYSRGLIHIKNLAKIQQRVCECDAAVNSHYERVFDKLAQPGA